MGDKNLNLITQVEVKEYFMSRKIRAILMDMDGTLLGSSQVAVSIPNMMAVQAAISQGIHVIPLHLVKSKFL